MRLFSIILLACLAGCASSIERMNNIREAAPEWYETRKEELSGKGYPSVADVPQPMGAAKPIQRLSESQDATLTAFDAFVSDPKSIGADVPPETLIAWAQSVRLAMDENIPPADFLTDEDVAAMKAVFDRPRGRL